MKQHSTFTSLLKLACGIRMLAFIVAIWIVVSFSAATHALLFPNNPPTAKPRPKGAPLVIRHSDKVYYNEDSLPGVQIFVGNVEFYHDGVVLKCDSARYFQNTNSFMGFNHVSLRQGDTLSLRCGFLHYDGENQFARARTAGGDRVVLTHRRTTLYTDSLDYDRAYGVAWFFEGGRVVDEGNILTSDWGQYNAGDRQAIFNYSVELRGKDNNILNTDTLYYNVFTKKAKAVGRSVLTGNDYTLVTDLLNYDTRTKDANVVGPSNIDNDKTHIYTENGFFNTATGKATLLNRSVINDNGSKMIGDSIVYDKNNSLVEGYGDVIYQDPKNKTDVRCDMFTYDKITGFANGFGSVVFNDALKKTRLSCNSFNYNKFTGEAEGFGNVAYNDTINKTMLTGNYCYYNDSLGYSMAYDSALVCNYSDPDTIYLHADTLKMYGYNLHTDSVYRVIHGYYHARTYRTDVQCVADTLSFNTRERRLSLYGNPIVWNDSNQIVGEEIHTYFNDSTIDSVYVVKQALLCERLDTLHYNQIACNEMHIYFQDGHPHESHAIQNVNVNYFQYDDKAGDSIIIAMNHAETSLLRMTMENKKVRNIWTAEMEGMFYPIIFVTPKIMYLDNFAWFDYIRPQNKDDVFNWRSKSADKVLHKTQRREVPLQKLRRE